jgi:long-subunit acyl-CoA synthetase (AMP-forming)
MIHCASLSFPLYFSNLLFRVQVSDVYPRTPQEFNAQFSFKGTFDPKKAGQPVQRGEVCMRGPGVTIGYFKNEKDTREVSASSSVP